MPLIKVGGFGHTFFTRTEGVLLRSDNLLAVRKQRFVFTTEPAPGVCFTWSKDPSVLPAEGQLRLC